MLRRPAASRIVVRTRTLPVWVGYATTVAIVLATFLLRWAVDPILPLSYPYLLAFVAIVVSASLFNHGSGLLATALSAIIVAYLYLPPVGSLAVQTAGDAVSLGLFVCGGVVITLIVETLHSALADLQRALADLERSNADLSRSEHARGLLLREFRHRTRNDLHSLVGLLLLRARAAPSDAARDGLREAADHAMALARVHTRLARNARDDAASVDTRDFVSGLGADLQAAQTGEGLRPVVLSVAAESHALDAERAVQVGLVLNEAITNALKYGFPDERAGTVRVTFVRNGAEFVLTVADDGVGLSEDDTAEGRTPPPRGTGIGTRLLRALAAQLRGSFSRRLGEDGAGTVAELRFPADPLGPSR